MTLTEETVIDRIEVLELGQIQIREATRILKNGEIYGSPTYHRRVLSPGDTIGDDEDSRIQAVAHTLWTDDVIAKYLVMTATKTRTC